MTDNFAQFQQPNISEMSALDITSIKDGDVKEMVQLVKNLMDFSTTGEARNALLRDFAELKHKFAVERYVEEFVSETPVM